MPKPNSSKNSPAVEIDFRTQDNTPIGLGKYRLLTPRQILVRDPQYICWMYENIPDSPIAKGLYDEARSVCSEEEEDDRDDDLEDTYDRLMRNN